MDIAGEKHIYPLFTMELPEIVHGAVTRHGGVSGDLFSSNNISFGVGDERENVIKNRAIIKKWFGFSHLVSAHQVHGTKIHRVKSPVNEDQIIDGVDALITDVRGVGLMIGHADCQTVLLYDSVNSAIAAIHNGWRGSVANIVAATVTAMQEHFGSKAEDLVGAIGPSLGPCCAEFINYEKELPLSFRKYRRSENHFDFWEITRSQLVECGVMSESISCPGICTVCSADFFSYRQSCRMSKGITGRNGTVIGLRQR